jgi:hypothetical protein
LLVVAFKKNYCDYRNSLAKKGRAWQLPQKKLLKRLLRTGAIAIYLKSKRVAAVTHPLERSNQETPRIKKPGFLEQPGFWGRALKIEETPQ